MDRTGKNHQVIFCFLGKGLQNILVTDGGSPILVSSV